MWFCHTIEKDANANITIAINRLQKNVPFLPANNQLCANHRLLFTKANKFCLSVKCWLSLDYYAWLRSHINNLGFVFHQGIQTPWKNKSTRLHFHQFLGVWIPWWNTHPHCSYIISHSFCLNYSFKAQKWFKPFYYQKVYVNVKYNAEEDT